MILIYGYLPTVFDDLKTFSLDVGAGAVGKTISTSAEAVDFLSAIAYVNATLSTATGGDMSCTFNPVRGQVVLYRTSGSAWEITNWKARGFFGFDYPIDKDHGLGGVALGAQVLEGLEVVGVSQVSAVESREMYGDSYHHHSGTQLELEGFIRSEQMRQSHRVGEGIGSDLGWHNYKGRIKIVDTDGDVGAWSVTNPTGYIDGRLIQATVAGQIAVLNAELWRITMKVAL